MIFPPNSLKRYVCTLYLFNACYLYRHIVLFWNKSRLTWIDLKICVTLYASASGLGLCFIISCTVYYWTISKTVVFIYFFGRYVLDESPIQGTGRGSWWGWWRQHRNIDCCSDAEGSKKEDRRTRTGNAHHRISHLQSRLTDSLVALAKQFYATINL